MINFDYHTHTTYSHGTGSILDNAVAAKNAGLKGIAITDHGFSHLLFSMKRKNLDQMLNECREAEKQTGVIVKLGIESNIIGEDGVCDLKEKDYEKIEVFLAGMHRAVWYPTSKDLQRVFIENIVTDFAKFTPTKQLIDYNTKIYCNAIKNNPIDILTHPLYGVFADPVVVAECCADYGTYFEINTKKIHLSAEQWRKVIDTKVNFIVDSDAHSPDRVGDLKLFLKQDEVVCFPKERIFNFNDRTPTLRYAEFKKRL